MTQPARSRGVFVRGELLCALRRTRGWSQEEAASRAHVSDKLLRKAEKGGPIDVQSAAALVTLYQSSGTAEQASSPLTLAELIVEHLTPSQANRARQPHFRVASNWLTETWNRGNLPAIRKLSAADLRFHCESGTLTSHEEVCHRIAQISESFSKLELQIETIGEANGLIVCRWRLTMQHTAPWFGLPPTNRAIQTQGITSFRIDHNIIHEVWEFWTPQAIFLELAGRVPNCHQLAWKPAQ